MLSHPRAITPVKDVIHDSIIFNIFEREVIDSIFFQRLHFVLQNSTTYVAYPANKNSRFAHSLGVASIAGRMFTSALNHASHEDADSFLTKAGDFLAKLAASGKFSGSLPADRQAKGPFSSAARDKGSPLVNAWRATISGVSRFAHANFLRDDTQDVLAQTYGGFPTRFVADTLWQAVRIYALIHDIGHLPMSHSFEHALERIPGIFTLYGTDSVLKAAFEAHLEATKDQFVGFPENDINQYASYFSDFLRCDASRIISLIRDPDIKMHERRSLCIFNMLFQNEVDDDYDADTRMYRNFIWHVVVCIFLSTANIPYSADDVDSQQHEDGTPHFLRTLKSIVDGEVDADRMDYTIRDGVSSGTTIGLFDLSRVLNNTILVKEKNGLFYIAFYKRAISGIEQFFNERHESYKYLIQHRTSSRTEICLQDLLARLFHFSYSFPDKIIADLMTYYGYLKRDGSGRITDLLPVDKLTVARLDDSNLRTLLFEIYKNLTQPKSNDTNLCLTEPYARYAAMIRDLLSIILFRDYQHIYNPFKNTRMRDRAKELLGESYTWEKFQEFSVRNLRSKAEFTLKEMSFRKDLLKVRGVHVNCLMDIVRPKTFTAYVGEVEKRSVKIVLGYGEYLDAHEYSEFLRNMQLKDGQEAFLRIYFIAHDIKKNKSLIDRCDEYVDRYLESEWQKYIGNNKQEN